MRLPETVLRGVTVSRDSLRGWDFLPERILLLDGVLRSGTDLLFRSARRSDRASSMLLPRQRHLPHRLPDLQLALPCQIRAGPVSRHRCHGRRCCRPAKVPAVGLAAANPADEAVGEGRITGGITFPPQARWPCWPALSTSARHHWNRPQPLLASGTVKWNPSQLIVVYLFSTLPVRLLARFSGPDGDQVRSPRFGTARRLVYHVRNADTAGATELHACDQGLRRV